MYPSWDKLSNEKKIAECNRLIKLNGLEDALQFSRIERIITYTKSQPYNDVLVYIYTKPDESKLIINPELKNNEYIFIPGCKNITLGWKGNGTKTINKEWTEFTNLEGTDYEGMDGAFFKTGLLKRINDLSSEIRHVDIMQPMFVQRVPIGFIKYAGTYNHVNNMHTIDNETLNCNKYIKEYLENPWFISTYSSCCGDMQCLIQNALTEQQNYHKQEGYRSISCNSTTKEIMEAFNDRKVYHYTPTITCSEDEENEEDENKSLGSNTKRNNNNNNNYENLGIYSYQITKKVTKPPKKAVLNNPKYHYNFYVPLTTFFSEFIKNFPKECSLITEAQWEYVFSDGKGNATYFPICHLNDPKYSEVPKDEYNWNELLRNKFGIYRVPCNYEIALMDSNPNKICTKNSDGGYSSCGGEPVIFGEIPNSPFYRNMVLDINKLKSDIMFIKYYRKTIVIKKFE